MAEKSSRTSLLLSLCAAFLIIGLVQTYPLLRHMPEAVPYSAQPHPGHEIVSLTQGDHLQLIYHFWLFKDALEGGHPFLPASLEFSVREEGPSFSPQFFPLSFGYWIFSPLGPSLAYNLLLLLSFILSGLSAYLLCSLFFSPRASFLGGAVFALFPFRYGQLMGGHSNGFVSFLTPLCLALLIVAFRSRRPLAAFSSGLAFLFLCSTDLTAAYFTSFLFFPLLLLLTLSPEREARIVEKRREVLLPSRIEGLPDGPALPFLAGAAAGIAYHLSVQRTLPSPEWLGSGLLAVPLHGLLAVLVWKLLAALLTELLPLPPASSRRLAGVLLLPFSLLLLYPLGIVLAIPFWGRSLFIAAAFLTLPLLVSSLRSSGPPRLRTDLLSLLRSRAAVFLPVLLTAASAMALIYYEQHTRISGSSIGGGRSYQEVKIYSPGLRSFLPGDFSDAEKILYPGLTAFLLTLLYLLFVRRSAVVKEGHRGLLPSFFFWGGLIAALLAIGPRGEHISPLFRVFRDLVPLYDLSRAPSRIYLLTAVALALGTAGGMDIIGRLLPPRWGKFAVAVIFLLLLRDYLPPSRPGLSRLPLESDVYRRAAADLGGDRLMDVPIWPGDSAWSSLYLYYATLYGTPTINGYSPIVPRDYFPTVFTPLEDINLGEIGEEEYRRLVDLEVGFLVFHEEAFPPKVSPYPFQLSLDNLRSSPYLEFVKREGSLWLFRLREDVVSPEYVPRATSVMGKVYEAEDVFRHPGEKRAESSASGGRVVDYPPGPPIQMSRPFPGKGKYPTGRYRLQAFFRDPQGPESGGVRLEVVNRESGDTLATIPFTSGLREYSAVSTAFTLDGSFELDRPTPIAFRLSSDGRGPLSWDFLHLLHGDEREPRWSYEAEDLIHMGLTVDRRGAGGGRMVQLLPDRDPADFVLVGPDRILPEGRFRATLRYRLPGNSPRSPGRFEAGLSNAPRPLSRKDLPPRHLREEQEVSLAFRLTRPAPVRFKVYYNRAGEVLLDSIVIEPMEPD